MARDGQSFEQVDKRQSLHEQDCAYRYAVLGKRMTRMEIIMWSMVVVLFLGVGNHPGGVVGFLRDAVVSRLTGMSP